MSKIGAAFAMAAMLAVTPVAVAPATAAEAPHSIARQAAFGCRDRAELYDLLFLGMSTSFDTRLAAAITAGRCVFFDAGETVAVMDPPARGVVRVQRGGTTSAAYWTVAQNVR